MDDWRVGDLVKYKLRHITDKMGMIREIRNKKKIAYIEWADNHVDSHWVSYDDMILLSRE